jgi:hypothetical protein
VWWAYTPNQTRPVNEVMAGVYSGEYEAAMRSAFFYVVMHYPRQTFQLYAEIKSVYIWHVLREAWHSLFVVAKAPVTKTVSGIVAAQALLLIAFALALAAIDRTIVDRRLAIVPVFFVASLAPLYIAWASFWTTADTVVLFYCCLALAVLLLAQLVGHRQNAPVRRDVKDQRSIGALASVNGPEPAQHSHSSTVNGAPATAG